LSSEKDTAIDFILSFVPATMKKSKVPSVSLAILRGDELVYATSFGSRDVERNLPATPDTLYGIGSCTKSFVAMGVMQLVEKGKLSLDDPVSEYVPLKIGLPSKPITIHHLLTHSSGIPNLGTSTVALHRGLGVETGLPLGSVDDFYRHVNGAGEEIASAPGQRFFYLNEGYRMLGHIIQEVSGKAFDAYITENILSPLGMRRTTFSKQRFLMDPNRITPYLRRPDGSIVPTDFPYPEVSENPDFAFVAAAGGITSSVRELTNYLSVNINLGAFEGKRLLSQEAMKSIQTLHIEREPDPKLCLPFSKHGYGYGWDVVEDFLGYKMVSHGGSILVSTAHLAFIPDQKIGIALASNIADFPYAKVVQGVFAALMGKNPRQVPPTLRIQERLETLTGSYETYRGISKARVLNKGGLLYFEQTELESGSVLIPLIPESDGLESNRFYIWSEGTRQPVEFEVHSADKIDLYVERNRYHKIRS